MKRVPAYFALTLVLALACPLLGCTSSRATLYRCSADAVASWPVSPESLQARLSPTEASDALDRVIEALHLTDLPLAGQQSVRSDFKTRWRAFLGSVQPGDEIWQYRESKGPLGWRSGFVLRRACTIVADFSVLDDN